MQNELKRQNHRKRSWYTSNLPQAKETIKTPSVNKIIPLCALGASVKCERIGTSIQHYATKVTKRDYFYSQWASLCLRQPRITHLIDGIM